jgi:hypothetical protein
LQAKINWKSGWPVWGLSLVASYLVFAMLAWDKSPNWDELWLLGNTLRPMSEQLEAIRRDMAHPPLVYLVFRGWLQLFGHTEAAVKGLIVLVNSACLFLFSWLAHEITRHWRLATILFSCIYFQIGSVPNLSRAYGIVLLCTVAAVMLWREWSGSGHLKWLVGWTLVMTVSVYANYFGFLLLAAFLLVTLLQGPNRKAFIVASLVPALMILPWVAYVLAVYEPTGNLVPPSLQWITRHELHQGLTDLPVAFQTYIEAGSDPFADPVPIMQPEIWQLLKYAVWILCLLFVVLIVWNRKNFTFGPDDSDAGARWFWRLFLIAGVPVAALLLVSLLLAPMMHPRFLTGILPVYWLVYALIIQLTGRPGRLLGYFALVPLVLSTSVVVTANNLDRSGIRARVQEVADDFRDRDAVLSDSAIGAHVFWEWRGVQHRTEPVIVVRAGEVGHIPYRERRRQNVVPYHNLEDIPLGNIRRVWYFYSNLKESQKAERYFSNLGFQPITLTSVDRQDNQFGLLKFVVTE